MIHQATDQPPLPAQLATLQQNYPDWSIWTSTGTHGLPGRCYATRLRRDITDAQRRAGLSMTIEAITPGALADKLAKQQGLTS